MIVIMSRVGIFVCCAAIWRSDNNELTKMFVTEIILLSLYHRQLHAISLALSLIRCSNEKNFIIFFGLYVKLGSYKWI